MGGCTTHTTHTKEGATHAASAPGESRRSRAPVVELLRQSGRVGVKLPGGTEVLFDARGRQGGKLKLRGRELKLATSVSDARLEP